MRPSAVIRTPLSAPLPGFAGTPPNAPLEGETRSRLSASILFPPPGGKRRWGRWLGRRPRRRGLP